MKKNTISTLITEHTTATIVGDNIVNSDVDTVLIKVASRCNINCTYCYVYNMGDDNWKRLQRFIDNDTVIEVSRALYDLSVRQKRKFSIVLHGGEPFLLGKFRLRFILESLRSVLNNDYPISIQSNGILIDNEFLDICSTYKASVAISIDGPPKIHNKARIKHNGEGTFLGVIRGINLLKEHPDSSFLNAGLLAVIDPHSDPAEIYNFFKQLDPPSVDFLYRDGNHTVLPFGKTSLSSIEYGEWMVGLMHVYLEDINPFPIRVLDDMLKVLLGGIASKEGMGITDFGIIIIDTDGTVTKNDTLKSSFNGADRFNTAVNIKEGGLINFLSSSEFLDYKKMQRPVNQECLTCPLLNVCGGGMILHRWEDGKGFEGTSVYCADQKFLIENMKKKIQIFQLNYA